MKALTSKSRQNFFTISTIVGLLVIFSFYFFIYVPQQERKLNKENFRVLTKITGNIVARVNEYKQFINDQARTVLSDGIILADKTDALKGSIINNNETKKLDSLLKLRPEIKLIYFRNVNNNSEHRLIYEELDEQTKPYLLFVRDTCSFDTSHYEYGFTINAENVNYWLDEHAFENYFLRRNNKVIYGPTSGVLPGDEDSLLKSMNGLKTGRIFSQEISGSTKKIFAQPFRLGTEDDFVLCGLMDGDVYRKGTRNLSGTVILIILLILFLLALSLPFVKFLLMSRNERLNISDALLAGITVILGTSVMVLILLDVYTYYIPEKETQEVQLKNLSEEISKNFSNEVLAASKQLEIYDSLVKLDTSLAKNIISLRDSSEYVKKDEQSIHPTAYDNFKQVFWTDSTGKQLFKWSATDKITPLIHVSERSYFKDMLRNKAWSLPGNSDDNFYFEGIYSWTTGENTVVIAKKSNLVWVENGKKARAKMIAMTTVLNSVMDPILPVGNGFCIIDNNGKVIFHSVKSKNLSENFLEECSAHEEIDAAMYSRTSHYFSTTYQRGYYKMYLRPVSNLPFYLVTFQDNLYPVSSNTEVLTLSVLFVVFFFFFICIQVIVLRIITRRESLLKAKVFSFDWLWPLKEKQKAYQHILIFIIPAFFLLLFFLQRAGPVETLLIFFVSSVFTFALVYLKIDQFKNNDHRKSRKEFLSPVNRLIIGLSLLMLIVLNIISGYLIDNVIRFCTFQVILCGFAIAILIFNIPVLKSFSFRRCYLVILLGILSLVSIIPTFAFFRISFEKEMEVNIRHLQLELASELSHKSDELNKPFQINDCKQKNIYCESFYDTRFFKSDFLELKDQANSITNEDTVFSEISISLTPSYNEIILKENNLASPAFDSAWKWEKYGDEYILFRFYDLQRSSASGMDSLTIISKIPPYELPMPFGVHGFGVRGTLFWIAVLFGIIALYCFTRFFVRIIFTTDFFRNNQYNKLGFVSLNGYFDTTNVFLVGPPYSGKSNWLLTQCGANKIKYHINLNSIKTLADVKDHLAKCNDAEIIVIDQFEYGFRDFAIAKKRLRLFEGLRHFENKRILVMSNIHPKLFLQEYPKQPVKQDEAGEVKNDSADNLFDDCERWSTILDGYHKIYFPAGGIDKDIIPANADVIDRECKNSFFLRNSKQLIRETINLENTDHLLSEEEIILRIESLAHVYYNAIWSSLSEEEQYILYDIAQDGLVNLKNRDVLTMLLNKGLLVYENRFKMMNESFRNFVLLEVSADDALELERKVKETGSWNYFKTPVVITLITIAVFIFVTQEQTFNSIIAFITTFAAGIPIVFRLLGMITSMKGAKKIGN